MYSDAHTHISGTPFGGNILTPEEIDVLLKNNAEKGVVLIIAASADFPSAPRLLKIASAKDMVYASIGIHPWIAHSLDDATYNGFKELARHPKVVAFGEIGLDESRSRSSKEIQMQCLAQQFRLCRETGLPPIIHERGMHKELQDIRRQENPPAGAVHGFSGSLDELKDWLDQGYSITVGKAVLGPEGQGLKEIVQAIPDDRLLLETDGVNRLQDGAIEGQERVVQVAQVVAAWRGSRAEKMGDVSTTNLKRLFKIA